MDNKKVGNFIYELRKEKSMTQQDLAELLGVTNKAVSKWERGEGYPEITLIPVIAQSLDVTVDELLHGEKNDSKKIIKDDEAKKHELKKHVSRFKNLSYIALGLSVFGVIEFIAIRLILAYYMASQVGLVIAFVLFSLNIISSMILYFIFYNNLKGRLTRYREENGETVEYHNSIKEVLKTQILQIWLWVIPIFLCITHIVIFLLLSSIYRFGFSLFGFYARQLVMLTIATWVFSLIMTSYKKKLYTRYGIEITDYNKKSKKVWSLVLNIFAGSVATIYLIAVYETSVRTMSFGGIESFLFLIPIIAAAILNIKRLKV